nr:nucleoside hydrolase [uncultured Cohaesibacter sp.]
MLWVDTDFGFDDLWALLILKRAGIELAGVSLVAGNAPLPQVTANALGANLAYGLSLPLSVGAERPLVRDPETATAILGPKGMRSLGMELPESPTGIDLPAAGPALIDWLESAKAGERRDILALGPLTNMARMIEAAPEAAAKITRLVWMGGSNGPGNHTPHAEFNAFADPDSAAIVAKAGLPLDVIDLTLCRTVQFTGADCPSCDQLTADLLGGYLHIAHERGRDSMSIYDPVAAFAYLDPTSFGFLPVRMDVITQRGSHYGATQFDPISTSRTRLATTAPVDLSTQCLGALSQDSNDDH